FNQYIITKSKFVQCCHTSDKGRTQHKVRVGLSLQNMPESFQFGKQTIMSQTLFDMCIFQIDPAYYAFNERELFCQIQQKVSLLFRLISLYSYASIDFIGLQKALQVRR